LVSVTVVATGVAYAIASPYRGPFAGIDHPGSVTVRVVEPVPNEWSAVAICRTRERGSPVFMVETSHGEPGGRTLYVTLNLSPGTTPVQGNLWLQFVTMPASPVRYLPSSGNGLDVTLLDAKGLTGSLRFAAAKEPNPLVSPGPEPARLTGTLEWACEPTPSG
jgi:hypothetical protein